jgi:hypothetical protein
LGSTTKPWVVSDRAPAEAAKEQGIALEVVKLPRSQARIRAAAQTMVVERSFAWATRCRRLVKDYERYDTTLAGLHVVAFVCLMLKQGAIIGHLLPTACRRPRRSRQLTWGKFIRHIWGVFTRRSQTAIACRAAIYANDRTRPPLTDPPRLTRRGHSCSPTDLVALDVPHAGAGESSMAEGRKRLSAG